jgi:hypothetical protein
MLLRLVGYCFLCLALAALAFDGARMIADDGHLAFTSIAQHWNTISPASLAAFRALLVNASPYLLSPLVETVLVLPAWIVAGGLGTLAYLAGYRPPRPTIPDGI